MITEQVVGERFMGVVDEQAQGGRTTADADPVEMECAITFLAVDDVTQGQAGGEARDGAQDEMPTADTVDQQLLGRGSGRR